MHRRTTLFAPFIALAGLAATRPAQALYDPRPNEFLAPLAGAWRGTLAYRDWRNPERMVTLQTRAVVTPVAPDELALYLVFADGPGKTVYSYERMSFGFAEKSLLWVSGSAKPNRTEHRITTTTASTSGDSSRVVFERTVEQRLERHTLDVQANAWQLGKVELVGSAPELLRNRYEFTRAEG